MPVHISALLLSIAVLQILILATAGLDAYKHILMDVISFQHIVFLLVLCVLSVGKQLRTAGILPLVFLGSLFVGQLIVLDLETVKRLFFLSVLMLGSTLFLETELSEKSKRLVFGMFALTHGFAQGVLVNKTPSQLEDASFYQNSFYSNLALLVLMLLAVSRLDVLKEIKFSMTMGYVLAICSSVFLLGV